MENSQFLWVITLSLLTVCLICSIIALGMSIFCTIKVIAAEKSTHNLEYVPVDPNWASTDKEIEEVNQKGTMEFPELDIDEVEPHDLDLKRMI